MLRSSVHVWCRQSKANFVATRDSGCCGGSNAWRSLLVIATGYFIFCSRHQLSLVSALVARLEASWRQSVSYLGARVRSQRLKVGETAVEGTRGGCVGCW